MIADRVIRWLIFCPRCSFRAHVSARNDQIRDHIDTLCPGCRQFGLDAIEQAVPSTPVGHRA